MVWKRLYKIIYQGVQENITILKITRLAGKTPKYRKTETYFNKTSKWLKRMIARDQENVFLFKLYSDYRTGGTKMFILT